MTPLSWALGAGIRKLRGKIRMMADGSAEYVKKLGLENDMTPRGMGVRSQRFSILVDDGVVSRPAGSHLLLRQGARLCRDKASKQLNPVQRMKRF